ncbi:hypothetical protein [Bdellovibrio bacteriovorus]|uniref:hypothetical protein n=1 Tax=Bdellovibrio bacteriovorus TaxID=959 RepID=UPI0035A68033
MKFYIFLLTSLAFSSLGLAQPAPVAVPSSVESLHHECRRVEESYPEFACLRFEIFQSSAESLQRDLNELLEAYELRLEPVNWKDLLNILMRSMDAQIYRYQHADDIEILRRTKAKNQWELLKLREGLEYFWLDPHTYWFPSVDAISFVAVNTKTSQIVIVSHGERN